MSGCYQKQLEDLSKTHTVKEIRNGCEVQLKIPLDFIYDVHHITLKYTESDNSYEVFSRDLPSNILENMLAYQGRELKDLVEFLEGNLGVFCAGKKPSAANLSQNGYEPAGHTADKKQLKKLASGTPFPTANISSPNLRSTVFKTGILLFCCPSATFTVQCLKCQRIALLTLNSQDNTDEKCTGCTAILRCNYVPICSTNYLGFLSLKQCKFVSFEPSIYQFNCDNCQSVYETERVGLGERVSFSCFTCFNKIYFQVEDIEHISKDSGHSHAIKLGTELPDRGTCKHYKKSQRWFRFPCCQMVYPCDICHDEASEHEHEMANKMICGLCSKEQSVKQNCDCGMTMKRRNTAFWEGGKGNRDPQTMSRKDSKKNIKRN